ncbi:MAG: fumarate hydratase [Deltaproteobacteria bacterium]|nr:fumarate hydratase [Deltaproteobacteria bacterium]NIS76438.1 fumarate hydratase [Deltaproteobacteria bacterium]
MREINVKDMIPVVSKMCIDATTSLGEDVIKAYKDAIVMEESPAAKDILQRLIENAEIAREEGMPVCQDCGFAVLFVDVGQDVRFVGGDISEALTEGVRKGYEEGFLRKSIVAKPATERVNTGDNTPPVIHYNIVPGDRVRITFLAKGGGCENMSSVMMLTPAQGLEGIKKAVIERVRNSGGNPCPPIKVGVGIGGTFEKAAMLAKKALLRKIGEFSAEPEMAAVERELLEKINNTGIGPQGLGGRITAFSVSIESHPSHIASLPLAINIDCHVSRHKEVEI